MYQSFVLLESVVVYKMGIETCLESPWWHFASARCQLLQCVAFGGAWEFFGSNSRCCAAGGESLPSVGINCPTANLHICTQKSNHQIDKSKLVRTLGTFLFTPPQRPQCELWKAYQCKQPFETSGLTNSQEHVQESYGIIPSTSHVQNGIYQPTSVRLFRSLPRVAKQNITDHNV